MHWCPLNSHQILNVIVKSRWLCAFPFDVSTFCNSTFLWNFRHSTSFLAFSLLTFLFFSFWLYNLRHFGLHQLQRAVGHFLKERKKSSPPSLPRELSRSGSVGVVNGPGSGGAEKFVSCFLSSFGATFLLPVKCKGWGERHDSFRLVNNISISKAGLVFNLCAENTSLFFHKSQVFTSAHKCSCYWIRV